MKSASKIRTVAAMTAVLLAMQSHAQTNTSRNDAPIIVDKVVANPEKFKGTINVVGRVAKLGSNDRLFALSCEDACFSMPVRFSGPAPKQGTDVIVRGQIAKEANGRYVFNAESVTSKK